MRTPAKLLIAAAALALIGVAWLVWSTSDSTPTRAAAMPDGAAEPVVHAVVPRAAEPSEVASAEAADETRAQAPPTRPQTPKSSVPTSGLDVRVVWADTRQPCPGIEVSIVPIARGNLYAMSTVRSDAAGLARFTGVEPGLVAVFGNRSGGTDPIPTRVQAGQRGQVELEIARGCRVEGRIVGAPGAAVSQPEIWLSEGMHWRRIGESDDFHHFEFEGIEPGSFLVVRAREWLSSRPVRVECEAGATVPVELVVDLQGALILGQVLDPDEQPIEGAVVAVEVASPPAGGLLLSGKPYVTVRTDDEGRFAILGQGKDQLLRISELRFMQYEKRIDCTPGGGRIEHVARLVEGAVLIGRASLADGSPAVGAMVACGDILEDSFAVRVAVADAKGNYRITGLIPGRQKVEAFVELIGDGPLAEGEVVLAINTPTVWNPTLAPP